MQGNELSINIDDIDGDTFKKLQSIVKKAVPKLTDGSILSQENKKGKKKKDAGAKSKRARVE